MLGEIAQFAEIKQGGFSTALQLTGFAGFIVPG
jgi:hypothetical protein